MVPVVKNLPASAGDVRDVGSIPGSGRFPWRRKWQLTPVLFPGEPHGQRSLAGYSPWGRKASDTTERLTLSLSFSLRGDTDLSLRSPHLGGDTVLPSGSPSLKAETELSLASPGLRGSHIHALQEPPSEEETSIVLGPGNAIFSRITNLFNKYLLSIYL